MAGHDDTRSGESDATYDDLDLLERLESLREEMQELGVATLADIEAKIRELHARLDALDDVDGSRRA